MLYAHHHHASPEQCIPLRRPSTPPPLDAPSLPANNKVTPMLSKVASHSVSCLCPDNFQHIPVLPMIFSPLITKI